MLKLRLVIFAVAGCSLEVHIIPFLIPEMHTYLKTAILSQDCFFPFRLNFNSIFNLSLHDMSSHTPVAIAASLDSD